MQINGINIIRTWIADDGRELGCDENQNVYDISKLSAQKSKNELNESIVGQVLLEG